jgi:hypothetical protein
MQTRKNRRRRKSRQYEQTPETFCLFSFHYFHKLIQFNIMLASPLNSQSQWPHRLRRGSSAVCLLPCGFESRRWHGCLSLECVVCHEEVSASGWSPVQRRPTECGVSECDREASIMRPWPTRGKKSLVNNPPYIKHALRGVMKSCTHTSHKPITTHTWMWRYIEDGSICTSLAMILSCATERQ